MKPVEGGTYRINEQMIEDLRKGVMGHHASNLAAIITVPRYSKKAVFPRCG